MLLLLAASACGVADTVAETPVHTNSSETVLERTSLSAHERARADLWGLSVDEWQRYRTLMEGIRGSISPKTLSPIEVLGIHARDDTERRIYAERWAVMLREDAARILAFQQAYDEAGRRLFPDEALIDVTRLPVVDEGSSALKRTDRVLLFVRPDCAACDALLTRILARLDRIAGVDIFLDAIAAGDDEAIRAWARERGIRPEWVTTARVTLNFDDGTRARVAPGHAALPVLLRRRADALAPLSGSAF